MDKSKVQFVNPVGTSAVKLQEQVKLLNEVFGFTYKLTGDESYKQLQTIVTDAQEKAKAILEKDGGNDTKNESAQSEGKKVYVWLKNPAYVDVDGKKRVAGGFYHINLDEYPRLKRLPKTVCQIFEGSISASKQVEIAKWFGVNPDKHADDELLDVLVQNPTLY